MGGINFNPEFADVMQDDYIAGRVVVGTSAVEAKVGATRLDGREMLVIYNDSNRTIFHGPSGVTASGVNKGIPILKGEFVSVMVGNLGVFLIASGAGNNVIVQEWA
jgi:hypothetical protein